MANYLVTSLFFCDASVARTAELGDGFGARFLFAFLASIASVAREAHALQRALICFRG
jgi:hypothetical protein